MDKDKILISGTGCALADFLYSNINFNSKSFKKYLSEKPGDGGLSPGKLVFTNELEKFANNSYPSILKDITGGREPDGINIGGPGLVPMIHVAQVLGRDDFDVRFFGGLGKDEIWLMIRSGAGNTPLDISGFLAASDKTSPFTDVFSDPLFNNSHGERTFINNIGAASDYNPGMLPDNFFQSDIVCFGGTALVPLIHDNLTTLLKKGKQNNCVTIVNTVFDFRNEKANPLKPWPLVDNDNGYSLIDVLIMDLEESLKISGTSSSQDAFEYFSQKGISSFFITNGAGDVIVFTDGRLFEKPVRNKFPVSRMVTEEIRKRGDTTGCGDNFAGGIIESIAIQRKIRKEKPMDMVHAVARGIAAGGFACSYLGGTFTEKSMYEKRGRIVKFIEDYSNQLGKDGSDK